MRTTFRLAAGMLSALATAGSAAAAPCDTLIMQTRDYGPTTPNFTQLLTFDQYHGPLSDICEIKVKLQLEIEGGRLGVDNDGADPATVTVRLGATSAITSTDVTLLNSSFQPVTGTAEAFTQSVFNLAGDNGDGPGNIDISPPDGAVHFGGQASDMRMGLIHSLFWPGFVGPGTFDIRVNANQILDFGSVGGVEGEFTPVLARGNVMVIYTIPDPATLAMLGLGAAAYLGRRRFR